MARYFFNIRNDVDLFDVVGTELAGAREISVHMMAMARLWIEKEEHRDTHWHLEARDEHENIVGSMTFGREPDNGV